MERAGQWWGKTQTTSRLFAHYMVFIFKQSWYETETFCIFINLNRIKVSLGKQNCLWYLLGISPTKRNARLLHWKLESLLKEIEEDLNTGYRKAALYLWTGSHAKMAVLWSYCLFSEKESQCVLLGGLDPLYNPGCSQTCGSSPTSASGVLRL